MTSRLSNLPPGVTDRMIEEQAQPFDPGYDYEQDKDICERLEREAEIPIAPYSDMAWGCLCGLMRSSAREIRALRLHVKNQSKRIDQLLEDVSRLSDGEE